MSAVMLGHTSADVEKWTAQDAIAFAVGEIAGNLYRPDIVAKVREAGSEGAELMRRGEALALENGHLRRVNQHLIALLSAIHMRCAPADVTLEDGRTMRFVPPNPEFYWRELSEKVRGVQAEVNAIYEAEGVALAAGVLSVLAERRAAATFSSKEAMRMHDNMAVSIETVQELIAFVNEAECKCQPEDAIYEAHTCGRCRLLAQAEGTQS